VQDQETNNNVTQVVKQLSTNNSTKIESDTSTIEEDVTLQLGNGPHHKPVERYRTRLQNGTNRVQNVLCRRYGSYNRK